MTRPTTVLVLLTLFAAGCGDGAGGADPDLDAAGAGASTAGAEESAGAPYAAGEPDVAVDPDVAGDPADVGPEGAPDAAPEVAPDAGPAAPLSCVPETGDAAATTLLVRPYLQHATPQAISVLWETDAGDEARLEWGPTPELGQVACGEVVVPWDWLELETTLHRVRIDGLEPDTRYWYRASTGAIASAVHDFRTPPPVGDPGPFRLVAMSDSQRAGAWPDMFREVVEDGVIAYVEATTGGDLADEVAMVVLPGDLVDQGWELEQWTEEFFEPTHQLLRHVPLYPALGNHEGNSLFYFRYLELPDNGTPGYEEHWYHVDYGNLRLIGLDSNEGYRTETQLQWLAETLEATCADDAIDFVFAQLHHPHRSELWTPGNTDYTGEVIALLEGFSTACGKPSVHFFGHTHGYSRGQSRDHAHVMVNVASAGGAIDRWGEHDQQDYEEYVVSQDEWGFVMVEVSGGADPTIQLQRVSRGHADLPRDNEVRDELVVKRFGTPPDTPAAVEPTQASACDGRVTLTASGFADPGGERHQASHWQVAAACDGFDEPLAESWRQRQNQYMEVDLQADDDLTDELFTGLAAEAGAALCWRVRYRDSTLVWSAWSEPAPFDVGGCP